MAGVVDRKRGLQAVGLIKRGRAALAAGSGRNAAALFLQGLQLVPVLQVSVLGLLAWTLQPPTT